MNNATKFASSLGVFIALLGASSSAFAHAYTMIITNNSDQAVTIYDGKDVWDYASRVPLKKTKIKPQQTLTVDVPFCPSGGNYPTVMSITVKSKLSDDGVRTYGLADATWPVENNCKGEVIHAKLF